MWKPKFLRDTTVSASSDPALKGRGARVDIEAARRHHKKKCQELGLDPGTLLPTGEITRGKPRDMRLR